MTETRPRTCFNCLRGNVELSCSIRIDFHPSRRLVLQLQGCPKWVEGELEAIVKELPMAPFRQKGKPWVEERRAHHDEARRLYEMGYRVAIPTLPLPPPPFTGDPLAWMYRK